MIFFLHLSRAVAQVWEHMADQGYCSENEQKIFRAVRNVQERCHDLLGIEWKTWEQKRSDRWE